MTANENRPDSAAVRGVIPHLNLDGRAGEAAEFYARAFGARDLGRFPDNENPGRFMHVQLEINGGALMMTDCRGPGEAPAKPQSFSLTLVVTDGEAWWSRALAAGCTVVMPFERQFWGDRWGMLLDPFGLKWGIDEPAAA
ncbi:MAG TPA: glyoxalase/bleomycin resistance/extradiol dioxygenase family protein [Hyphomicrobiales bacterium]|nr:glyoxalase/bleomycin resistance/extradiol dioxygenase family protein [Hyphomicrobiales bacterium]